MDNASSPNSQRANGPPAKPPLINANLLSGARLLLTPLLCYLLLIGSQPANIAGFILYMLIGATDYFDGKLARKYGTTKFGSLLDNFSDKIFLVLFFGTLGKLALIPYWIVILIIMRDPIICSIRFLSYLKGFDIEVEKIGKYKTAIQMFAGGYILWVGLFGDRFFALPGMALVALAGWLLFIIYCFKGEYRLRLLTFALMTSLTYLTRYHLSSETANYIFALIVLIFTWLSALHYIFLFMVKFPAGSGKIGLRWWIISFLESYLFPFSILFFLSSKTVFFWLPLAVLSVEFLSSACNYIVASQDSIRRAGEPILKLSFQYALLVLIMAKNWFPSYLPPFLNSSLKFDFNLLLITTIIFFVSVLFQHHKLIMEHMMLE